MVIKSCPLPRQNRRKSCRAWHSLPVSYKMSTLRLSSKQRVQSANRKKTTSSEPSPRPGPSGISSVRFSAPLRTSVDQPPDRRVHSRKRKDRSEERPKETSKKSRSDPSLGAGPSHLCSQGKSKARGSKETPLVQTLSSGSTLASGSSLGAAKTETSEESHESVFVVPSSPDLQSSSSSEEYFDYDVDDDDDYDYAVVSEFKAKYQQMDKISQGGFAHVFAGVRIEDNFPVAIKRMRREIVRYPDVDQEELDIMVPLEVNLLTKMGAGPGADSCSVTPVLLDWYDLGPQIVLVLERPLPCMDLFRYIQEHPDCLSEAQAKKIIVQLVDAALVLESKGVFHRDMKPSNILIETGHDDPVARIIDFGCATDFIPGQEFYDPQGTPVYSSPEWFRDEVYQAGPTTVWQVGLVLFECLFNRMPLIFEKTIGSMRGVPIPLSISPADLKSPYGYPGYCCINGATLHASHVAVLETPSS